MANFFEGLIQWAVDHLAQDMRLSITQNVVHQQARRGGATYANAMLRVGTNTFSQTPLQFDGPTRPSRKL